MISAGDEITMDNGQINANSKTELSNGHIITRPVDTMVITKPSKEKSDSSIAEVLKNEYASNRDKQLKRSFDSEASITGRG